MLYETKQTTGASFTISKVFVVEGKQKTNAVSVEGELESYRKRYDSFARKKPRKQDSSSKFTVTNYL